MIDYAQYQLLKKDVGNPRKVAHASALADARGHGSRSPLASELVLRRRRRRAARVREVLDDRVLRPAADGQRLADVALLVYEDEPRLLALAVDDLELVVLTGLVLDEARDDGVVLELSLANF